MQKLQYSEIIYVYSDWIHSLFIIFKSMLNNMNSINISLINGRDTQFTLIFLLLLGVDIIGMNIFNLFECIVIQFIGILSATFLCLLGPPIFISMYTLVDIIGWFRWIEFCWFTYLSKCVVILVIYLNKVVLTQNNCVQLEWCISTFSLS